MRFATYTRGGSPGFGVLSPDGETIIDLGGLAPDIESLVAAGRDGLARVQDIIEQARGIGDDEERIEAVLPIIGQQPRHKSRIAHTREQIHPTRLATT